MHVLVLKHPSIHPSITEGHVKTPARKLCRFSSYCQHSYDPLWHVNRSCPDLFVCPMFSVDPISYFGFLWHILLITDWIGIQAVLKPCHAAWLHELLSRTTVTAQLDHLTGSAPLQLFTHRGVGIELLTEVCVMQQHCGLCEENIQDAAVSHFLCGTCKCVWIHHIDIVFNLLEAWICQMKLRF